MEEESSDGLETSTEQGSEESSQEPVTVVPSPAAVGDKQKRSARRVDYQELDQDDEFEAMLRDEERQYQAAKRRRLRAQGYSEEDVFLGTDQVEQETAWAMDFSAMAIVEEEEGIIPSKANELDYVKMRNYVLSKWRAHVDRHLSEEEAIQGLKGQQRAYAQIAWRFLDALGFINFGVAHSILKHRSTGDIAIRNIIVVGAGVAGLAAAQQLKRRGHNVIVLEGHNRPGGRVYSKKLKAGALEAVADLGGSILTGIDGNPLAVLARQLQIPLHEIEQTQVPIYLEDGTLPAKELDESVEEKYNSILDACSEFRDNLGEVADQISLGVPLHQFWEDACALEDENLTDGERQEAGERFEELRQRFFEWHTANLEFANAASVNELSVRSWDQDDPHELPGSHCFVPGGNIRLVAAMTQGLRILYNTRVKQIKYSEQEVAVKTTMHVFKADAVLVTVPLGVLKHKDIFFDPPLPLRKQQAIQRIGFGLLNKIVLLFPYNFWGVKDMFGRLPMLGQQRGEGYLFYSYAHISGAPVLAGLICGEAAREFEERSLEDSTRVVLEMLRGIFEPQGVSIPSPLQVCCTRWGKDEMARGSYSSMAVGALGGDDYDIIGESLGGRVFFAGESTTRKYPATMHGAFHSGTREAANIVSTLVKLDEKAKLAQQQRTEEGVAADVQPLLDTNAYRDAALIWAYLQALEGVFKDPSNPPDKEFGCFAAVFGPPGTEWQDKALLRIDVGSAKGKAAAKSTPAVLVTIPIADLHRLQDVASGDEAKLSFLATLQSVKLVGRADSRLSQNEVHLLRAVVDHRKGPDSVPVELPELPKSLLRRRPPPKTASTAANGSPALPLASGNPSPGQKKAIWPPTHLQEY